MSKGFILKIAGHSPVCEKKDAGYNNGNFNGGYPGTEGKA
jgi:hypothetical protein